MKGGVIMNDTILNDIDQIEELTLEAEMGVLFALCDCYEKQAMILEYSTSDDVSEFSVFQEGFYTESSNSGKKRSVIKAIIDIILRMCEKIRTGFQNLIKRIFGKKDNQDDATNTNNTTNTNFNDTNNVTDQPIDNASTITILNGYVRQIIDIDVSQNFDISTLEDKIYEIDLSNIKYDDVAIKDIPSIMNKLHNKIKITNSIVDDISNSSDEGAKRVKKLSAYCSLIQYLLKNYMNILRKIHNREIKPSVDLAKYKSGYLFKYDKRSSEKLDPDTENKLIKLFETVRTSTNYREYKEARDQLCEMVGFEKDRIFMPGTSSWNNITDGYLLLRVGSMRENRCKITLKPGTKLYHTTHIKGLSELKPCFRAGGDKKRYTTADSLYPTSRVYFFVNNPGYRTNTDNSGEFKISYDNIYIYEYTVTKTMTVNVDTEASSSSYRKAVFIETEKPIPVKDVTDQFKK